MSQTEERTKGYSEKEIDELFGAGKRFWNSDEDFEIWLEELREMRGHGKKDNGWILGNKPEKEGNYQVTVEADKNFVDVIYYDEGWSHFNKSIIAHKPIALSEPYKPPEPERDNLKEILESMTFPEQIDFIFEKVLRLESRIKD